MHLHILVTYCTCIVLLNLNASQKLFFLHFGQKDCELDPLSFFLVVRFYLLSCPPCFLPYWIDVNGTFYCDTYKGHRHNQEL